MRDTMTLDEYASRVMRRLGVFDPIPFACVYCMHMPYGYGGTTSQAAQSHRYMQPPMYVLLNTVQSVFSSKVVAR